MYNKYFTIISFFWGYIIITHPDINM